MRHPYFQLCGGVRRVGCENLASCDCSDIRAISHSYSTIQETMQLIISGFCTPLDETCMRLACDLLTHTTRRLDETCLTPLHETCKRLASDLHQTCMQLVDTQYTTLFDTLHIPVRSGKAGRCMAAGVAPAHICQSCHTHTQVTFM